MKGGRSFRPAGDPSEAPAALGLLADEGFRFEPEPFWSMAQRLIAEPRPLGSSLAAAFGLIYVQDRSSMLPPLMLSPAPGSAVLDLCASPGGKSGIAATLTGPAGFVLANEPNPKRLATLCRNLLRSAAANAATCSWPGEEFPGPGGVWPQILLDPPCSGWGAEDKHPKVKKLWRGDKIEPLIRLQRKLLAQAAALLAPGGRLMYSTCTTNPDENEAQVSHALDHLGLELLPLSPPPGVDLAETFLPGCLCVAGGDNRGQGFFLALMSRPGGPEHEPPDGHEPPGLALTRAEREAMDFCDLSRLPSGEIRKFGEIAALVPEKSALLPPGLNWRAFPLGRLKSGRFFVEPRARMLVPPGPDAPALDVDETGTLQRLLSGQGVEVPSAKGFMGLRYRGAALGWLAVKNGRALWTARS